MLPIPVYNCGLSRWLLRSRAHRLSVQAARVLCPTLGLRREKGPQRLRMGRWVDRWMDRWMMDGWVGAGGGSG